MGHNDLLHENHKHKGKDKEETEKRIGIWIIWKNKINGNEKKGEMCQKNLKIKYSRPIKFTFMFEKI